MTADVCDDCNVVAESLRGRTWTKLSAREVDALSRALPLLSARALRYYLPAVVMRALEHPASPAIAALLSRLAPPEKPADWREEHRLNIARTRHELLALMRPEQLDVLRSFAEWASAYPNLRAAATSILESYDTGTTPR
jgi:hypothetical protein